MENAVLKAFASGYLKLKKLSKLNKQNLLDIVVQECLHFRGLEDILLNLESIEKNVLEKLNKKTTKSKRG